MRERGSGHSSKYEEGGRVGDFISSHVLKRKRKKEEVKQGQKVIKSPKKPPLLCVQFQRDEIQFAIWEGGEAPI